MAASNTKLVKEEEVHAFVIRCMQKAGTSLESCRALADVIVVADARGVFSHGLNRLGKHLASYLATFSSVLPP